MRKVLFFMMVTLDGFFEGPNHTIDWHNVDKEFNTFANEQLDSVGTLLFGRVTYELMAAYWPTPSATKDDPEIAEKMNRMPKIVFSRTLNNAAWQNTRLIKENIVEEISKLKAEPGKDMILFGSSDLSVTLIQHGLIDEIRIMVNPVVLGNGTTLFNGIQERLRLRLMKTKTFHSGNVLLYYQPEMKPANP
jgi:dihydrofolate reductase